MVGHIEIGIATVVRDFLPARIAPEDLAKFARLWTTEEEPAPPPFHMPTGQLRMLFLKFVRDGRLVGWASGPTYSVNLRRMISLGRRVTSRRALAATTVLGSVLS